MVSRPGNGRARGAAAICRCEIISWRLAEDAASFRGGRAQRLEAGDGPEIRRPRAVADVESERHRFFAVSESHRAPRADPPGPRPRQRGAQLARGSQRATAE